MADAFDPYYEWLGIPPKDQPPNAYRLLGIELFESAQRVIESAADRQMSHIRTFQTGAHAAQSQKLLNEIARAKVGLLNPAQKAQYDERLRARLTGSQVRTSNSAQPAAAPVNTPIPAAPVGIAALPRRKSASTAMASAAQGVPVAAPALDLTELETITASHIHKRLAKRQPAWQKPAILLPIVAAVVVMVIGGIFFLMRDNKPQVAAQDSNPASQPSPEPVKPSTTPAATKAPSLPPPQQSTSPLFTEAPSEPAEPNGGRKGQHKKKGETPTDSTSDASDKPTSEDQKPASGKTDAPPADSAPASDDPAPVVASAQRLPVPDEAARAAAAEEVRNIFSDDLTAAKNLAEKLALIEKMFDLADKSQNPVERYALLDSARRTGIALAIPESAFEAINRLAGAFEIDWLPLAAETTEELQQNKDLDTASRNDLVIQLRKVLDSALEDQRCDIARRLNASFILLARKLNQRELINESVARNKDIVALEKELTIVDEARQKLQTDPDDSTANLALGKHFCFAVGDWSVGLPHLAKGSDEKLKAAAEQDLAAPEDAAARLALADMWWNAAPTIGPTREKVLLRAAHWYELALDGLSGLNKTKVEKRLAEIAATAPTKPNLIEKDTSNEKVFLTSLQPQFVDVLKGLHPKKIMLNGLESPHGLFTHPRENAKESRVEYVLPPGFWKFGGKVIVNDSVAQEDGGHLPASPIKFHVEGDGKVLWISKALTKVGDQESFDISLRGVKRLGLVVEIGPDFHYCHAAWFEPVLTPLLGTAPANAAPNKALAPIPDREKIFLVDMQPTLIDMLDEPNLHRKEVSVEGVKSPHGLFTHPKLNPGLARVDYNLAGNYRQFEGMVAVNDSVTDGKSALTASPLKFHIEGDGKILWKSSKLFTKVGDVEPFRVSVKGVKTLSLFVEIDGDNHFCHASWVEPALMALRTSAPKVGKP